MKRKRVTEVFPWLLPLRKKQRTFFFYAAMALDRNHYARDIGKEALPFVQYTSCSPLYNQETGFDMKFQENKVFNLRLAAAPLDGLLIKPGETFSFWKAIRYADRETPYREGLTVTDGRLMTAPGGGLCQMSNLLFSLFLRSPLTITERKGHRKKDFPDPGTEPAGADATVSEGWIDLKAENKTETTFQIKIAFDAEQIRGYLRADRQGKQYEIYNRDLRYWMKGGTIYQRAALYRRAVSCENNVLCKEQKLYDNVCEIGYSLPDDVAIIKE